MANKSNTTQNKSNQQSTDFDIDSFTNYINNIDIDEISVEDLQSKIVNSESYKIAFAKMSDLFADYYHQMNVLNVKREKTIEIMRVIHLAFKQLENTDANISEELSENDINIKTKSKNPIDCQTNNEPIQKNKLAKSNKIFKKKQSKKELDSETINDDCDNEQINKKQNEKVTNDNDDRGIITTTTLKKQRTRKNIITDNDIDNDAPKPTQRKQRTKKNIVPGDEEIDNTENFPETKKPTLRKQKTKKNISADNDNVTTDLANIEDANNNTVPETKETKRKTVRKPRISKSINDINNDDTEVKKKPIRKPRTKKNDIVNNDADNADEVPDSPKKQKKSNKTIPADQEYNDIESANDNLI